MGSSYRGSPVSRLAETAAIKAVHVIAGLSRRDGGPYYSVPRLCGALSQAGAEVDLLTVRTDLDPGASVEAGDAEFFHWDHSNVPLLRSLRLSRALALELGRRARSADVVHNHGLWLMPNVYSGEAAASAGKPFIVTPRGMLAPAALRFSRGKKLLFWHLLQKQAFRQAKCFHATSEQEYQEFRSFGINVPVAIIPNGMDVPPPGPSATVDPKTLLYVGRLHPKKDLPSLIQAWAAIEPVAPEWRLRIVGPSEGGHLEVLQQLVAQLCLRRVVFDDPVYGVEKESLWRQANVAVLPSRNENFGLVVAEALAAGLPVIASRGTPWGGLVRERCGWWVENDPASLAAAIGEAISLPPGERKAMGARGREWVERDFGWSAIAEKMAAVYAWMGGKGEMPGCVVEA